jgi:putative endonuclease
MTKEEKLKARRRGRWGERLAECWLLGKGFRTIGRGMRTPVGEIDLIVRRRNLLVFVEVKSRRELQHAYDALRPAQRARIIRAGSWFLTGRPDLAQCDLRYDVVLVGGWSLPKHLADAWRVDA